MENLKAIIAGSVVGLLVLGLIYWKFSCHNLPRQATDHHQATHHHLKQHQPGTELLQRRATQEEKMPEPKPEFLGKMQSKQTLPNIDSILTPGTQEDQESHLRKLQTPTFSVTPILLNSLNYLYLMPWVFDLLGYLNSWR